MAKFSSNSSNTSSDFFIDEGSDAIEYLAGGSVDPSCESNKDDECKVEDEVAYRTKKSISLEKQQRR